jgi:hypothetical protein
VLVRPAFQTGFEFIKEMGESFRVFLPSPRTLILNEEFGFEPCGSPPRDQITYKFRDTGEAKKSPSALDDEMSERS